MANFYCDTYDAQFIDTPSPTVQPSSKVDGRLKRCVATIEADAMAADSVIYVCKPPKGARWSSLSKVTFDDLGTGCTLDVGIPGAATKFATGIDCASAAGSANLGAIAGIDYEFDGVTPVICTPKTQAITGTVVF